MTRRRPRPRPPQWQQEERWLVLERVDFYGSPAARPPQVGDSSRPGRPPWSRRDGLTKSWRKRRNDEGSTKRPRCSGIRRARAASRAPRPASSWETTGKTAETKPPNCRWKRNGNVVAKRPSPVAHHWRPGQLLRCSGSRPVPDSAIGSWPAGTSRKPRQDYASR